MSNKSKKSMTKRNLCDGLVDNLEILESLDLSKINSFDSMARAMSKTAFGGRAIGEAVDIFEEMVKDKDCFVVLTLSGAMTVAKMGLIVCDMIDNGMVDAVVSTGALMTHGLVEAQGMGHFKYKFGEMDDTKLFSRGYDRIYDTIELEKNLDDTDLIVRKIFENINQNEILCSVRICEEIGKWLKENVEGRGILKSAYEKKVPVYIPAFTDSEMGLDFALFNRRRKIANKPCIGFNPFFDLEHFTRLITKQKTIGIFTIGGGVPRNWAQQVTCYTDLIEKRIDDKSKENKIMSYKYGVRICPEPIHWGGLSGCTYSEGISWGKFKPISEGGRYAEVLCDATIAWPIIIKAVMERLNMK